MQGTFIGVLMSATLPARLGEPSRALIVARRLGRARETLPVVLGTMVSQTLLNLLALAILGGGRCSPSVERAATATTVRCSLIALAPLGALLAVLLAPVLLPPRGDLALARGCRRCCAGLRRLAAARARRPARLPPARAARPLATTVQLGAWALQWLSCWLLLMALGLDQPRRDRRPPRACCSRSTSPR